MNIKADKKYQEMILSFIDANEVDDFPEEVNVVYAVWIPTESFEKDKYDVVKALSNGLGVDIETIDEVDGGDSSKRCLSTEINVSKGSSIHAIDWIRQHQCGIDSRLEKLNLECGIIVED